MIDFATVAEWRFGVETSEIGLAAGGSKATLVQRVRRLVNEEPSRDVWQRPGRRKLLTTCAAAAVVALVGFAPRVALPLTPISQRASSASLDAIEFSISQLARRDWHGLNEELLQLEADLQRLHELGNEQQPAEAAGHFRNLEERAASLRARREYITSLLERNLQR